MLALRISASEAEALTPDLFSELARRIKRQNGRTGSR